MSAQTTSVPAETYAEQLLRKAWDGAYTPDLRAIADETALTVREVEAIRDRMLSGRKDHRAPGATRPAAVPLRPEPPAPPVQVEAWRRAIDHPNRRLAGKATKVLALIADIEAGLAAEAERDTLRAKEVKLAAELAKVRAQLRGDAPAAERVPCPDCGDLVLPTRIRQHALRSRKHQ